MKIGVVTSAYPEFTDDPHGIFVHRLMKKIKELGHDVHVIAPHTGGKTRYTMDGVHVEKFHYFYPHKLEKLCGRAGMVDNVKEGFLVKFQVLTFLFFNLIYSLWKFKDKDIIHVQWPIPNGLGGLFLDKIYGIPYINTVHGEEIYLSKRYNTLFALKWIVNNSNKTITNSSATKNMCLDCGIENEKLEIIPFGVDIDFFRPLKLPKQDDVFQILSVGYLIERKGFEYLIKAIKKILEKHPHVKLDIVGTGPLENKLKNMILELELSDEVQILQNVSDDELLSLYNQADLFVLPSIRDSQGNTEGLGVVLIEAMACGLPVIGSNIGGIPDIIKDRESGLLFNEKDIDDLSLKILSVIEDEELKNRLSINGSKRAQQFTWTNIASRYIEVYNESLK